MEIRELKSFLQVAQCKNISTAAKSMGYTQAAVTIQIKRLEKSLHADLFDRVGNKMFLTEQGRQLYTHATKIVKDIDNATDIVSGNKEPSDTIVIGTIESICASIFPKIIRKYHSLYPKVDINVIIGSPIDLLREMDNNAISIVYFMDQKRYDTKWEKVIEKPADIVFVASKRLCIKQNTPMKLKDIIKQPFILTEKDASYRYVLDQLLAAKGLKITPFLESANTNFLLNILRKEKAVSFLPRFSINEYVQKGELKIIPVEDFHLSIWQQVVYRNDRYLTNEMNAFIKLIKEEEKNQLID